jgi:hypothetical protein
MKVLLSWQSNMDYYWKFTLQYHVKHKELRKCFNFIKYMFDLNLHIIAGT